MINLFFLLLFLFSIPSEAKIRNVTIASRRSPWIFVDKFCFDERGGSFTLEAIDNTPFFGGVLALYTDTEDKWPTVAGGQGDCIYKIGQSNYLFHLTSLSQPVTFGVSGARPRWWYLAVANCFSNNWVNASFNFTFVNNNAGEFSLHFGKDEQGVYEMSIAFLAIFGLMMIGWMAILIICIIRRLHFKIILPIYVSLTFQFISVALDVRYNNYYSGYGQELPGIQDAALFFNLMAQVVFLAVLLLLAKGWPISTNFIAGLRLLSLIVTLYFLLNVGLFIWWMLTKDPALVLYAYASIPGYILIAIRFVLLGWAEREMYYTFKNELEARKRKFYIIMAFYLVIWFLTLPITAIVAIALPSWERKKVVYGIEFSLYALTYLILMVIFRPFRANKFFKVLDPNARVSFGRNKMQVFPSDWEEPKDLNGGNMF